MNFRQYTKSNQYSKSAIFKIKWLITNMSKRTRTQITVESVFITRFTMNNIAQKLQICWTHKIVFNAISKMLKQPNVFYSQLSAFIKDASVNFTFLRLWFTFYGKFCSPYLIADFLRTLRSPKSETITLQVASLSL